MISSTAWSASAYISSSVRSWIGWATKTRAASNPSRSAWALAASMKGDDATSTPGIPLRSSSLMSCTLHVVQEPQSASASITASQLIEISWRRSAGAGFANVGLR